MEGEIYNKLLEHDAQFEKIDTRPKHHDEEFEHHKEMMDFLARTAAEHTVRFDRIEARLENTATKDDIRDILHSIDWLIGNAKKARSGASDDGACTQKNG